MPSIVPVPPATIPVIGPNGALTLPWQRFFQAQQDVATLHATQITATSQTAATALNQANTATSAAGNPPGTAQTLSASGSVTLNAPSIWTNLCSVNFTAAVAVSSVGFTGSAPTAMTLYTQKPIAYPCKAQIVKTVGGVSMVVAGPVGFTGEPDGGGWNIVFGGFAPEGADATTGAITYTLQIETLAQFNLAAIDGKIQVTRTP